MANYFDTLYRASWRGASFIVNEAEGSFGRKVAVHSYPKRNDVYVEDMGRKPRTFSIDGFLVGDDVLAQRNWMKYLCEMAGPGLLVHPTHGIVNVCLLSFTETSRKEQGRVVGIHFEFIEAGQKLFPSVVTNAFGAINSAVGNLFGAAAEDFVSGVTDALEEGASAIAVGAEATATWIAAGGGLVQGATNLFHLASSLPGSFGRFAGGKTGAGNSGNAISSVGALATEVSGLIKQGAAARAAVAETGSALAAIAGAL